MSKQWVDITTIDNTVPFIKIRWKGSKWKGGDGPDCWFAEASGLTTDNMRWSQGTKDYGWFSAHRMNGGGYRGYPIYGCSFNFDHTQSGFWDVSGQVYRDSVKDAPVNDSSFYDTTVVIDGTTYYEVDFSLWTNASGYNLYMPYSNPTVKWSPGDIYVEIGTDPVEIDKSNITFDSTGGSDTVIVTADDDWTAVVSDSWITASTLSGTSGQTTVTITTPDYQDTTANRTGTIEFTCSGETVILTVTQKKMMVPGSIGNVYLGDLGAEGMYLGDLDVEAMYLGDILIFPTGPFQGIKLKPSSMEFAYTGGIGTLQIKSSTGWTLSYDSNYIAVSQAIGSSGDSTVQITALTNSTQADINTVITATTTDLQYSASTSVKIRWNEPFPQKPFMFNYNAKEYDSSTYTFPKKQGQLFNEDLVLDQAPTAVSADCVSFVGSSAVMLKSYISTSDNPFNRSSTNTELTAIYKVGSCTENTQTLFSSRGTMGYNYMIRGSQFHTSNASFLTYTSSTDPYIMLVRVQANGSCERTVLDVNGNVLQTSSSSTINWGSASEAVCFFSEKGYVNAQLFNGVFYWMYLANSAITDSDVLAVINYNENVVQPPQPVPAPTGFTKVTIDSPTPQYNGRYTFAAKYSDNKWYVATTQISNGTGVARKVTYNNDVISNIPSDVLLFELESAGYYEYHIKQAGTNNYLYLNNSNIVLGPTQSPTVFELGNRVLDGSGTAIDLADGVVCYSDDNGTYYTAEVNTYIDGDPDPIYAREFMYAQMDSNKAPFVAMLFEAN